MMTIAFYPATIAPVGPASNGGGVGFSALLLGAILAWLGWFMNRFSPMLRWCFQLPLAAAVTYLMGYDGLLQVGL